MRFIVFFLFFLLLPMTLQAASFAKESLFLSKASVTEGDTVLLHAVVLNRESSAFSGELVFSEAGVTIGSATVSLKSGEADTHSVSWKPTAGTHTVKAALRSADVQTEELSATFVIAAKPTASSSSSAVGSSADIQQKIAEVSPSVAQATAPAFVLLDGGRAQAATFIDTQITETKQKLATADTKIPGSVAGVQTEALSDPVGGFWYALYTIYFYLLTIARFIIGSAAVFYPLLAVLFIYGLWRLYRRMRRPAY